MPNRILRDGILTSEPVCSLSWAAEVFYRRLMSVVDDYGRFHALPKLLRASLYPLQIDKVSDADIGKWSSECEAAALVSVYPALDGKRYIQILKFGQPMRSRSKFPGPDESGCEQPPAVASNCAQPPADASVFVCVSECVSEVPSEPKRARGKAKHRIPVDFVISDRVSAWAADKGHSRLADHFEHFVGYAKRNGKTYADWDEALMCAIREDWAKLGGANGTGNRPGRNPIADRSAAGQVRAAVARSRAERLGQGAGGDVVELDGLDVRAQVG